MTRDELLEKFIDINDDELAELVEDGCTLGGLLDYLDELEAESDVHFVRAH